ncbi:hypothetical protein DP57_5942 [Burkholderia pseudomallei]|nr:hypothetical protein DP57_5942 [Burkholderia pseudomallei]
MCKEYDWHSDMLATIVARTPVTLTANEENDDDNV